METIGWPAVDPNRVQRCGGVSGPLRMPISHTLGGPGTPVTLVGKVESGCVLEGDSLLIMPNKAQVKVVAVLNDAGEDVRQSITGANSQVRVYGIQEGDVLSGSVLCSLEKPIAAAHTFTAKLCIVDKIIIAAGYRAVLHIHSAVKECEILDIMQLIDPKTGEPVEKKKKPVFAKRGNVCLCRIQVSIMVSIEKYSHSQQLGRLTLFDYLGKTVALGKVTELA